MFNKVYETSIAWLFWLIGELAFRLWSFQISRGSHLHFDCFNVYFRFRRLLTTRFRRLGNGSAIWLLIEKQIGKFPIIYGCLGMHGWWFGHYLQLVLVNRRIIQQKLFSPIWIKSNHFFICILTSINVGEVRHSILFRQLLDSLDTLWGLSSKLLPDIKDCFLFISIVGLWLLCFLVLSRRG